MVGYLAPEIPQAEIYCEPLFLICNERTRRYNEWLRETVAEPVQEVPDVGALLEATAPIVAGKSVVVAVGDSRTGGKNWPYALAQGPLHNSDWIVVNLGGWWHVAEDRCEFLEFYLDWLKEQGVGEIVVILLGCFGDLLNKSIDYANLVGGASSTIFSEYEDQLCDHRYGSELAQLREDLPATWDEAHVWFARRVFAVREIYAAICADAGVNFFAVLEPFSFSENTPSYLRALQNAYENSAPPGVSFDAWCREPPLPNYARGPFDCGPVDATPAVRHLQDLWPVPAGQTRHGVYLNWMNLFHDEEACCFRDFDGLHYDAYGSGLIARAVFDLLCEIGCASRDAVSETVG
jgi:lysophospholipase L1-like esterase